MLNPPAKQLVRRERIRLGDEIRRAVHLPVRYVVPGITPMR
jgi:hypothetical protein